MIIKNEKDENVQNNAEMTKKINENWEEMKNKLPKVKILYNQEELGIPNKLGRILKNRIKK